MHWTVTFTWKGGLIRQAITWITLVLIKKFLIVQNYSEQYKLPLLFLKSQNSILRREEFKNPLEVRKNNIRERGKSKSFSCGLILQNQEKDESKEKKTVKKKKSLVVNKAHEEDCFVCGEGGQLLLCDGKHCTKGYHLSCLNKKQRPQGDDLLKLK